MSDNVVYPTIHTQTQFLEDMSDIEAELKGQLEGKRYVFDQQVGRWVGEPILDSCPIMNQYGVNKIFPILKAIMNRNTFMSRVVDDEQRSKISRTTVNEILKMLFIYQDDFELSDEGMTTLNLLIGNLIDFSVGRAVEEGERRLMKETVNVNTSEQRILNKNESSGLQIPNPFKGGKHE